MTSIEDLLKSAVIFTGDDLDSLVFFREPGSPSDRDGLEFEFEDTLNLDPVPCSLEELAGEINPPSFIAYSKTYIYYYIRDVDPAGNKYGTLRIIQRTGGQILEIPYQNV